jgi:type VI secretion system protein ImpA
MDAGSPDGRDPAPLWRSVRELGLKTLTETTKDLEVAAWVTEAYVRSHGLSGLAAGAKLIAGLAENFWDDVFPLPDDYGVETRVAPITGLNGREGNGSLVQPLYKLTLYNRPDGTPFAFYQYNGSEQLTSLDAERKKARIEAGAIAFEDVEKEARMQGPRALARLRDEAREALEAWEAMATVLDEKASEDPPSTTQVRDMVRQMLTIANRYAPEEAGPADEGGAAGVIDGEGGAVASREDALKVLSNIATFFRKTEPLSPLSYTLDEAVRRGRMTWPELLEEIVADRDSRDSILIKLGIRPPPPPEE